MTIDEDTEAEVDMPNNGRMNEILLANSESNCNNETVVCQQQRIHSNTNVG
jgi:hypothetical protein